MAAVPLRSHRDHLRDTGHAGPYLGVALQRLELAHPTPAADLPPARASYYSVVAIRRGAGTYTCDGRAFALADRTVYLATPGHVKSFASPVVTEGYLLTFTSEFARGCFGEAPYRALPLLTAGCPAPAQLTEEAFAEVGSRCEAM